MSMHLCGPGLTTTSHKKRKQKVTKAQQEEFERGWKERNVRLKQMGLPKETLEQYMEWVYGKGKKEKKKETNVASPSKTIARAVTNKGQYSSGDNKEHVDPACKDDIKETHGKTWVTGPCTTKQTPTYTGTKIIGVAVLHKSCMQPIFSQEEAIDVAHMRR